MHQQVDKLVVQLARSIREQLKRAKYKEPTLCDLLLSLGECVDTQCEQRHHLLMQDRLLSAQMPSSGDVKLLLLRVYTPTHYCVRLLEHLPLGGRWQVLPRNRTLELQLQLLQSKECVHLWPPEVQQICVYHNSNGYERVRILRVDSIGQLNISRTDVPVLVQALDVDTRQFMTTSGKLFICPDELRDEPPLAIDVRIAGLVPYTGERNWHESDGKQCATWLYSMPQPSFLQARILTALSHTLFVHDLAVTSYAPSLQLHVRRLTMCQQLLQKQIAKKCKKTVEKLLEFLENNTCQSLNVQKVCVPPYEKPSLKTKSLLTGKARMFAKMAMQLGKENGLRLQQKQREQQPQMDDIRTETQIDLQQKSEDSIEALHNCLMKCTMMQLQQEHTQDHPPTQESVKNLPDVLPQPKVANKLAADVVIARVHNIHLQLPLNVLRPEVIYYQTRFTLELQILLPEDKMPYDALLYNGCCVAFWTLRTPGKPIYQFILNTHCPYQQLSHRMQGRTVYISVVKALVATYPHNFSFYKFMKPHYEKLHQMEKERSSRLKNFESYLLYNGYIQSRVMKRTQSSDDLSSDDGSEDSALSCREHVEHARDDPEFVY